MHEQSKQDQIARLYETLPSSQYSPEELLSGLIVYENEDLLYDTNVERPAIIILDDNLIEVNGAKLRLSSTKVFVLNALRLAQGYPQTKEDIQDLGLGAETVTSALLRLKQDLSQATKATIIETEYMGTGKRKGTYTLLPEVQIIDERNDDVTKRLIFEDCTPRNEEGTIRYREDGAIDFDTPRQRQRATWAMVNEHQAAIKPNLMLAQLFDGNIGWRTVSKSILSIKSLPQLSLEEEHSLLLQKEEGLAAYLHSAGKPGEADQLKIANAISAFFTLFAHNIDLIKKFAARWGQGTAEYSDVYQEAVLSTLHSLARTPYVSEYEITLRIGITQNLKKLIPKLGIRYQPVGVPKDYQLNSRELTEALDELRSTLDHEPTIEQLAEYTGMRRDKILGIFALESQTVFLDEEISGTNGLTKGFQLEDDKDELEDLLNTQERQYAIDDLFRSSELDDSEKIVLSLVHKLYHPSLWGAQIYSKRKEVDFVYPYTEEDFDQLVKDKVGPYSLNKLLGFEGDAVVRRLNRALRKARAILCNNPAFDAYGWADSIDAHQQAMSEAAEKEQIVRRALEISPLKRLSAKEVAALWKEGEFDANQERIIELFGSFANFQAACGFEPRKSIDLSSVSNDQLVALALQLRPDGPLSTSDVSALSKQGDFVSVATIAKRFGGMRAFHKACGF